MTNSAEFVLAADIAPLIGYVRETRVILDGDLASIYGVATKRLNEQFRRNLEQFPQDFAFQLTGDEWKSLRSQFATLKKERELTANTFLSPSRSMALSWLRTSSTRLGQSR